MTGPKHAPVSADRSAVPEPSDPDREQLFHQYLDLADRLAKRYAQRADDADDVRQVARIGLHLAVQRYRPEAGVFRRFATVTIIGELKKHLRNTGWAVHVPRSLQENALTVARAIDSLTNELQRPPTVPEIAERTHLSGEQIVEALRVRTARFRAGDDGIDGQSARHDVATTAIVNDALERLDGAMRDLVRMRFEQGLTQGEIGTRLGISQPQVHRRLTAALGQLRTLLEDDT